MSPPWIIEEFTAEKVAPAQMDALWASGWRRFGCTFFRYSMDLNADLGPDQVVPLRVRLADYGPSKSQRRILRRNLDLRWEIRPAAITGDVRRLFDLHRRRFTRNIPESLAVFLGEDPARGPCECLEFRCLDRHRLVGASFLDVGERAVSSVYAVFDPADSRRSPGILTLLREIEWAREQRLEFHHPGYTTLHPGVYEYKKRLRALEGYDWTADRWRPWPAFAREIEAPARPHPPHS